MKTLLTFIYAAMAVQAQIYSPIVTKAGQPDTSSMPALLRDIYANARASTPREKAEAIWRFFLTDGRFVKPGMIYHIAGWAYEEPKGEVLDPIKLLNSYGFGLCYHIAPLLEAAFEAGGFADARVWFLTGHTVAEVFYDGGYHYFDSDMMGYNTLGSGPVKQRLVASVHQLEQDGSIIKGQLARNPDQPWYPADVRANAIPDLAELFTSATDNWVFPYQRYSEGHTMDFVLRPGERMIRNFRPAQDRLFYLPFAESATGWREFPQEIPRYKIATPNGPRSQKDDRVWGTGTIEYRPQPQSSFTVDMPSPYVIIGAEFRMHLRVASGDSLAVETSVDGGMTWASAGSIRGPFEGPWKVAPRTIASGQHGKQTAVSGSYGYQVRFTSQSAVLSDLILTTSFALNPRTLPALTAGRNEIHVRTADVQRHSIPVVLDRIAQGAVLTNAAYVEEAGQGLVRTLKPGPGSIVFRLQSLNGFDTGGRFLDLRDGLAPDKFTAEVRKVMPWPANSTVPTASISWSAGPSGPWNDLWVYDPKLIWRDGDPIDRTLRWPEVDKHVRHLPNNTKDVYVRYLFDGMAIDDIRLATYKPAQATKGGAELLITHIYQADGVEKRDQKRIVAGQGNYILDIAGSSIENMAIILECPAR